MYVFSLPGIERHGNHRPRGFSVLMLSRNPLTKDLFVSLVFCFSVVSIVFSATSQGQSQLFAPRALSVSFTNRAVDDTGGTSTAGGPDVYNLFFSAFPARATAAAPRPIVRSRGLILSRAQVFLRRRPAGVLLPVATALDVFSSACGGSRPWLAPRPLFFHSFLAAGRGGLLITQRRCA